MSRLISVVAILTLASCMPDAQDSPIRGYAEIDDFKMYYEIHGAGDSILMLHGGTGHGERAWAELRPLLAPDYRLIIVDSRSQGRSTHSSKSLSYDLMTKDVVALMDHLEIERAHVIGASDGGIIGLNLAMKHPDRLDKVVAYGTNFHFDGLAQENVDGILQMTPETYGEESAKANYLDVSPNPEKFADLLEDIGRLWLSSPTWTVEELGKIETPMFIIDDTLGKSIRIEHTETMADAIPGARLAFIDDTDHRAYLDHPEEFARLAVVFFEDKIAEL